MEDIVKFRYKHRCGELKRYAKQAVNFINLADQGLGYEFKFSRAMNRVVARARCTRQGVAINFKFNDAASYKFNQTARHTAASKQRIRCFAEIPSQRRTQQISEIPSRLYVQQKIKIPSQWHARRSMRQATEISPEQYIRQAARILQNRSLPRAAKILLLRHMHGAEIARLMRHQIPAKNYKIPAESRQISDKSCRKIPAEKGAAR